MIKTLVLAILLTVTAGVAQAQSDAVHVVQAGETLFAISRQHNVTVQQLREWNNLPGSDIQIGQRLVINMQLYEREVGQGQTLSHTVEAGETLFRISRLYNVTIEDIIEWNTLEGHSLSIGQQLEIRPGARASEPAARTPRSTDSLPEAAVSRWEVETRPQGRFITYELTRDDNLDDLLAFHGMSLNEFRALNPNVRPGNVQSGDEVALLVPPGQYQSNPFLVKAPDRETHELQVTRYAENRKGTPVTNGDLYNPQSLTAAHPSVALGTVIYVENPSNGLGVFVLINDRSADNRLILSEKAYDSLQFPGAARRVALVHAETSH